MYKHDFPTGRMLLFIFNIFFFVVKGSLLIKLSVFKNEENQKLLLIRYQTVEKNQHKKNFRWRRVLGCHQREKKSANTQLFNRSRLR